MNSNPSGEDQTLDEICAAYIQAVEDSGAQNQSAWLAKFPKHASQLHQFIDNLRNVPNFAAIDLPTTAAPLAATESQVFVGDDPSLNKSNFGRRQAIGIGDVLGRRYLVKRTLGGGMGCVFIVDDTSVSPGVELTLALKTVADFPAWRDGRVKKGKSFDASSYQGLVSRFRREAENWIRIGKHENLIHAFLVIELAAKPYLQMEYANGGSLNEWIKHDKLTVSTTLDFAIQICEGMKYAYDQHGIIHRDLKPDNVLVHDDCCAKVTDFGLSKAFLQSEIGNEQPVAPEASAMSQAGGGTLPYMPPEQFYSLASADTRSDIYSFGAMLYEMLTGKMLFPWNGIGNPLASRRHPIPPVHQQREAIPKGLSLIIERCVAYQASDRFPSFSTVQTELRAVQSEMGMKPTYSTTAKPSDTQLLRECYSFLSMQQYEDALRVADQAIQQDPLNEEHWINKGVALIELDQDSSAVECFKRSVKLNRSDGNAWFNLALCHFKLGNLRQAKHAIKTGLDADRSSSNLWMVKGRCESHEGKLDLAIASFRQALVLDPENWRASNDLGETQLQTGEIAGAVEAFNTSTTINPDHPETWFNYATSLAMTGEYEQALKAVQQSSSIDADDARSWALQGLLIWELEHNSEHAILLLDRALQIDPNHSIALDLLDRINSEFYER